MTDDMIRVENLAKTYGRIHALVDVSFTVPQGEILGFLGPNGAGKSTTMRILAGHIAPTAGHAYIAGESVTDPERDPRIHFGYLPEHAPAYPEMSVANFLSWAAKMRGLKKKNIANAVSTVMDKCGLTELRGREIAHLSKGYRQRVGLAQALIHQPKVLILDEPLSGLDPNQVSDMRAVIKEFGRSGTVVFSSHILADVQAICDRVIILNHGRIAADRQVLNGRSNTNQERICITLRDVNFASAQPALSAIDGVVAMTRVQEKSGLTTITIDLQKTDLETPRAAIMKAIAAHDWTLEELTIPRDDLESVFRAVTRDTT